MKPQIETKGDKVVITIDRGDAVKLRNMAHWYFTRGYSGIEGRVFAMQLKDGMNESIEIACSQRMEKSP